YAYPDNGYIKKELVDKNTEWIDKYKIFIAKAYGERGSFPYLMLGKPFLGSPGEICSETYLSIGPFNNEEEALSAKRYITTKFCRFMVLLLKNTQDSSSKVYRYVPVQDFTEEWTDEKLYKKYELTDEEIAFIESMIRPRELDEE